MVVEERDEGDVGIQKYCAAPLRESSSHRVWGNAPTSHAHPSQPGPFVPAVSSYLNGAALQFRNDNITSTLLARLYYISINVHNARVSRQPPLIQHSRKANSFTLTRKITQPKKTNKKRREFRGKAERSQDCRLESSLSLPAPLVWGLNSRFVAMTGHTKEYRSIGLLW